MCGICGVAGNFLVKRDFEAFHTLLYVNALRGQDSTGVAAAIKHKYTEPMEFVFSKDNSDSAYYLAANDYYRETILKASKQQALIGHCRAATRGSVKIENAHPFDFEHILGVHNGTIWKSFSNSDKCETDSQALYHNINERGIEDALTEIERDTDGAYALAFFDRRNKSLNFIRNEARPLFYTVSKYGSEIYWSSTSIMLEFSLAHCNISHNEIHSLRPNTLLSLYLEDKDFLKAWDVKKDFIKKPSKGYTVIHRNPVRSVANGFVEYWNNKHQESEAPDVRHPPHGVAPTWKETLPQNKSIVPMIPATNRPRESLEEFAKKLDDDLEKDDNATLKFNEQKNKWMYKGFNGQEIPATQYVRMLNDGCMWCSDPLGIGDKYRWISPKEVACLRCYTTNNEFRHVLGLEPAPEEDDKRNLAGWLLKEEFRETLREITAADELKRAEEESHNFQLEHMLS